MKMLVVKNVLGVVLVTQVPDNLPLRTELPEDAPEHADCLEEALAVLARGGDIAHYVIVPEEEFQEVVGEHIADINKKGKLIRQIVTEPPSEAKLNFWGLVISKALLMSEQDNIAARAYLCGDPDNGIVAKVKAL